MRISLAGPYYTSRSVVPAAQTCMNLIPEAIEVPNEVARLVLYGRPGLKYFATLPQAKIRCLWSAGGGRLFAIAGDGEYEVYQNGTLKTWATGLAQGNADSATPDPAQIFSNGNQLMIVSGGKVYCDNGAGAVAAQWAVTGTGNTSNATSELNWVSGPYFNSSWNGKPITIDGNDYVVLNVLPTTPPGIALTLTTAPPDATGVTWTIAAGGQVDGVTGGFLDGYFIVNRVPTPQVAGDPGRQFNISGLMDGTSWNPLDFGVKEGAPDYIRSILCDHEELWLLGTETIEIWTNVGSQLVNGLATFPFQRIAGGFIRDGSSATWAPCSVGQTVCYLGSNGFGETIAYQATGLQPNRISTHAEEQHWNSLDYRVNDVFSYSYAEDGHVFWVLNFWQQQETFVYDATEGLWHTRAAWNPATEEFQRYLPWFHAYVPEWSPINSGVASGAHIVGDPATGKLYVQTLNYYTDDGAPVEYLRAFPHLINENQYAYHHRFELLMQMGALGPSDTAPLIGFDWSDDHGNNFNEAVSRTVQVDSSGDFDQRVAFRRLGKTRDRVYRVGIQATTKIALVDAYLEATQGFA